jgi:cysteine desulfurase
MRAYLDHAATSPLRPEAREAMLRWVDSGNPSSHYREGREARNAIDESREVLAGRFGCEFGEVIFGSGGTESCVGAILGAALANRDRSRSRILFSAAEHHCVLNTAEGITRLGYRVELLPVDEAARVRIDDLEKALDDDVLLVSVMHANNEFGSLNDVRAVSDSGHRVGAWVHCDAVQTFGFGLRVSDIDADLVSVSAHKIGGPKGVGALYVRAGTPLKPLISGGGQERELRAGTENVAAISGFAAATSLPSDIDRIARLRDRLWLGLIPLGALPTLPAEVSCLPGHLHVRFPGKSAESLLIRLDRLGLSAASGAACSSGSIEPSHVMIAAGYSAEEAKEGIRFTLGWSTKESEVDLALSIVERALLNGA